VQEGEGRLVKREPQRLQLESERAAAHSTRQQLLAQQQELETALGATQQELRAVRQAADEELEGVRNEAKGFKRKLGEQIENARTAEVERIEARSRALEAEAVAHKGQIAALKAALEERAISHEAEAEAHKGQVAALKAALEADTSGAGTDGRRSAADARSSLSAVRCNWLVRGKVRGGAYCSEGSEVTGQVRHEINLERFQIALLKCRVRQTQKRGQHENG
jgi:hypothetical protein